MVVVVLNCLPNIGLRMSLLYHSNRTAFSISVGAVRHVQTALSRLRMRKSCLWSNLETKSHLSFHELPLAACWSAACLDETARQPLRFFDIYAAARNVVAAHRDRLSLCSFFPILFA
ncbi:hypothetical protein AcV5_001476 [Taiwanofungus camphoratus]|nr:hypothetical protein AcV5_001476 [Antrodia cinnamomea]